MTFLTPGNNRRLSQLKEAALNLGMSEDHARHYAAEALAQEMKVGDWRITPQCAEAQHGNP